MQKNHCFGTIRQLCRPVSSQLRHLSTIGKKLVKHRYPSTCPHNMVNFGVLTAEICWRVWGTPANFNRFRVLAALLHGSQVVSASQTSRRSTEAGRPSRWALAHILVFYLLLFFPLLISAVGDWMSTILLHMAWP